MVRDSMVKSEHTLARGLSMPDWKAVSIAEASKLTGYHQEWLRQLCRDGKIEYEKIGRVYLIKWDSLQSYMKDVVKDDWRGGPKARR